MTARPVEINPQRLQAANRYINLLRNKAKRDYAWAYLNWMKNGGIGAAPERGRLSAMGAQAVEMQLSDLWR